MHPERFFQSPAFHAAWQERRKVIELKPFDRKQLAGSVGLTEDQWNDSNLVSAAERADIEEFVMNYLSHRYGEAVPLQQSEKQVAENRKRLHTAFEKLAQLLGFLRAMHLGQVRAPQNLDAIIRSYTEQTLDVVSFGEEDHAASSSKALNEVFAAFSAALQRRDAVVFGDLMQFPPLLSFYHQSMRKIRAYSHLHGSAVLRHHDWVHFAEVEADARAKGVEPQHEPIATDESAYLSQQDNIDELYPSLFLPVGLSRFNIPTMLAIPAERSAVGFDVAMTNLQRPPRFATERRVAMQNLQMLERGPGKLPAERRRDYETYLQSIQVEQAAMYVPDITDADLQRIYNWFELIKAKRVSLPARYEVFAEKVFATNISMQPRVFVDEVLSLIRTSKSSTS